MGPQREAQYQDEGRLAVGRKINSTQLNSRSLQIGGFSRIWTIRYGLQSHETQTRPGLRWRGPTATVIGIS
jgi:hypothetical protein